ncbi:leukotriene A-4 hydrolase/aminopeptidase [Exophiala oligosperma]|uniref:Leukotriene A(4) hydrolase n=2 Tax=Chaetothyriales TaxID=34395 RepID=A0A0D2D735_9EURO|nr:leukotriene A-4 hydrolase/aminopeptidase [Exophiala oligosperma]KIW38225.1 leukotriene A-4 hydrolase/aminopeptidase [Exophiala oligosperma]
MSKNKIRHILSSTVTFLTTYRRLGRLSTQESRGLSILFTRNMATTTINSPRDPNTLSNYNNWRTLHTSTTLDILFDQQKLKGTVAHDLQAITDGESDEIILDSSHVLIHSIMAEGKAAKWETAKRLEPYGSALKIKLDRKPKLNEKIGIQIELETTESCTALQWLTPAQTSNKKHPYMFSQCQAIHARSIFPCQDTPDVKATFDFNLKSPLPVIASGLGAKENPTSPSADGSHQLYQFHQRVPIPAYLYAIASGDISTASIGPRSTVATGPDELKDCTWELEESTEKFLKAGESLVYPYAWGEYNVLVLPPSFPYGGMENPVYTFATPTIISGDRENVDVIAHELSHSWSGNLVSNASWEHFWLNEGWTTYLERRIQSIVHGSDQWRDFSAIIGWQALTDSIKNFGEEHEFTKLVIDLKGKDPDDAFSSIPYEKGFNFLYYIEKLIGQQEFDKFIPHYFETWRGKSLDSYDFKTTLLDFFKPDGKVSAKLAEIDWDTWFYKPGFPPKPDFDTTLVDVAYRLAEKWEGFTRNPDGPSDFKPSKLDIEGWTANQVVVFLEKVMASKTTLPMRHANHMGDVYKLKDTRNVEVSARYYQIAMASRDQSIKEFVVKMLGQVGRMKFVRPLYRGLMKLDYERAVETFEKNKDFYHPICRGMVAKDLMGSKKE